MVKLAATAQVAFFSFLNSFFAAYLSVELSARLIRDDDDVTVLLDLLLVWTYLNSLYVEFLLICFRLFQTCQSAVMLHCQGNEYHLV